MATRRGAEVVRRPVLLAVLAVLVAAALAACAKADAYRGQSDTCTTARDLPAATTTRTMTSGGRTRSYALHVPPSYDGSRRVPLVVMFHGLGGDPRTVIRATGMAKKADEAGALLVVPLARGKVSQWRFRLPITDPRSDLAFVRDLVKTIKRDGCVDSERVYAAGFSNGSALTLALACDASTDFAAYAAVSGPYFQPACAKAPAASIVYFHGKKDPVVPFAGADTVIGHLPPVNDTMRKWATHDRCPASGATTTVTDDVQHFGWTGCAQGTSVDIYTVLDGVHGWPGGGPMSPGRTSRTHDSPVDATSLMWQFFARHRAGSR
ncbi:MAG: hypothetical protein JWP31_230 [Aeromicrobium sp.]|nr:hypothetical protein [Aeromicrobium sp.]